MGPLIEAKWEAFAQMRARGVALRESFKGARLTRNPSTRVAYTRKAYSPQVQNRIREIRILLAWGAGPDPVSQSLAAAARKAAAMNTAAGTLAAGRLLEMMVRQVDAVAGADSSLALVPAASPALPQPLSAEEWDSKYARRPG